MLQRQGSKKRRFRKFNYLQRQDSTFSRFIRKKKWNPFQKKRALRVKTNWLTTFKPRKRFRLRRTVWLNPFLINSSRVGLRKKTSPWFPRLLRKSHRRSEMFVRRRLYRNVRLKFWYLLWRYNHHYFRCKHSHRRWWKNLLFRRIWLAKQFYDWRVRKKFLRQFYRLRRNDQKIQFLNTYLQLRHEFFETWKLKLFRRNKGSGRSLKFRFFFRRHRCFNVNFLTTKTNTFVTVTRFFTGSILFSMTPRRLDPKVYYDTAKRTGWAADDLVRRTVSWLFMQYRKEEISRKRRSRKDKKSVFFINLYGTKSWLQKKMCKKLLKASRFSTFVGIRYKQFNPHNGCPFQVKKRKKNKGRNKWIKRQRRLARLSS